MYKYNFLFGYIFGVIFTNLFLLNSYSSLIGFTFTNLVFFILSIIIYLVEEERGKYEYWSRR